MREHYQALINNPAQVEAVLLQGAAKARDLAQPLIQELRHAVGLRALSAAQLAYDFGEQVLLTLSQRVANARPDDAIAFAKLNIEFNPQSSQSYQALAFAYTRKLDDESAITALEKAVEIDPNNAVARGQLEQLKSYRRKR